MLTKYNRRTVSEVSGAVIPGATVKFYDQLTGTPVIAYSDAAGLSPIGTSVVSGSAGEIGVFLPSGQYRITVEVASVVVEEITYEFIPSVDAGITPTDVGANLMQLDTPVGYTGFVSVDDDGNTSIDIINSDQVAEGSTNKFFSGSLVLNTFLSGLSTATNAIITAADTVLVALGKLQKQISEQPLVISYQGGKRSVATDLVDADGVFFIADRAYIVISAKYIHAVGSASNGTGDLRKQTGAQNYDVGNTVASALLDGANNTVQNLTITINTANKTLAAGDRLSFYTNALTYTDCERWCITVVLKPV